MKNNTIGSIFYVSESNDLKVFTCYYDKCSFLCVVFGFLYFTDFYFLPFYFITFFCTVVLIIGFLLRPYVTFMFINK